MRPDFLTPLAGLVALAALLPLGAALVRERRLRRVRRVLGLGAPAGTGPFAGALAAAAAIALLGLAAAQPVLATTRAVRTDAEAYVVLDNTRSMSAVGHRGGESRFVRAKALALRLRDAFPDVRWGVASLSDRTLVHVFPTADRALFADTLEQSVGIERPAPSLVARTATAVDSLSQMGVAAYFPPRTRKQLVVLFTDGESRPFRPGSLARSLRAEHIHALVVRLWNAHDRVYDARGRDLGYRPDPGSDGDLRQLSRLGVTTVPEARFGTLPRLVGRFLGSGPSAAQPGERTLHALAPFCVLATLVPLGLALVRTRR